MPKKTPQYIISNAITTALLTDNDLRIAVTEPGFPSPKIFYGSPPGDINLPFIKMWPVYGGEPANSPTREVDQTWIVTAISFNPKQANELNAIIRSILVNNRLPCIEGWVMWTDITVTAEYLLQQTTQGQQSHSFGGYYRIRLYEGI